MSKNTNDSFVDKDIISVVVIILNHWCERKNVKDFKTGTDDILL